MKKNVSTLVIVIFLLIGVFGLTEPTRAADPIIIGAPYAMGFPHGVGPERCQRLAWEEINAKGGINVGGVMRPVKMVVMDSRDLEPGVPASESILTVEKLILGKKADFLIGGPGRSEVALATMDVFSRYKKIWLVATGCATPKYTARIAENYKKYKYCFRVSGNAINIISDEVKFYEHLRDKFNFNKVHLMAQDVGWARGSIKGLGAELEKRGFTITGSELYPTGSADFSVGLLKAKKAKVPILSVWMDMPETAVLVKQWYNMKIPALMTGFVAPAEHPDFWKATDGKGAYVMAYSVKAGHFPTDKLPGSMKFVKAHTEKYGFGPTGYSDTTSYVAPYILKDAIEKAGTLETEAVIKALEQVDLPGMPFGRMRFDKKHDLVHSEDATVGTVPATAQWVNGKPVIVYPTGVAAAPVELPPWMR